MGQSKYVPRMARRVPTKTKDRHTSVIWSNSVYKLIEGVYNVKLSVREGEREEWGSQSISQSVSQSVGQSVSRSVNECV